MMLSIDDLKPFIDWLQANPSWAALAVFIISCAESLALVGLFIPGTIIMPAIGSMIGAEVLPAHWIILAAVLGAIVGDNLSFWLGYYFHASIKQKWPFRLFPNLLEKGETFFYRYGALSVFIGRFVGPVRPIIPVIAGMLNMSTRRFLIANVSSAIAWALLYMAPGIVLGMISEQLAPTVAARALVILAVISFIAWLVLWTFNKIWSLSHKKFEAFCSHLWQKITKNWPALGEFVHHLSLDNPKPLLILFYILFFIVLTLVLLTSAQHSTLVHSLDSLVYLFLRGIQVTPLDTFMAQLFLLTTPTALLFLGLGPFLWFLIQKEWRVAWYWCLNPLIAVALAYAMHDCVTIAPPNLAIATNFISSNLTLFCALLGNFILLSFYRSMWTRYKKFLWVSLEIVILLVALPQIYFGFHWPTGCLTSIACAAITTWSIILFFYRKRIVPLRLNLNPSLIIFSLTIFILFVNNARHEVNLFLKEMVREEFHIPYSAKHWLYGKKSQPLVVLYRTNFTGKITDSITLQYAGNLTHLERDLHKAGWHTAPTPSAMVILNRIGAKDRLDQLPLLPELYQAQKPALIMTKFVRPLKRMLVLRFWPSEILLQPHNVPLWLGTVKIHTLWHWHPIEANIQFLENQDFSLNELEKDLSTAHLKILTSTVRCYEFVDCEQEALHFYYSNNAWDALYDETSPV